MFEDFEYNKTIEDLIVFLLIKTIVSLLIFIFLILTYKDRFLNIDLNDNGNDIPINKQISNDKRKIKVCICTLGKKENIYIREFISHYYSYGVDKIFLYDNNDINEERFESVLSDYIKKNNFVEILNYRGKTSPQFKIYDDCYKRNYKLYNWLIFYDIDEFIYLQNYSNIKEFLSLTIFEKCKSIYLNCIRHTDSDLLYYENRSLVERFPEINWNSNMYTVKTILRGNLEGIIFKTTHWLDRRIKGCNVKGETIIPNNNKKLINNINTSVVKKIHIDHYCFKSTEEFINKINKSDGVFGYNDKIKMHKIKLYFGYNKLTLNKINYIEETIKINLTEYKKILYSEKYKPKIR